MILKIVRDERPGRHRKNDRATSIAGAADVAYRAGSQKRKLADVYAEVYPDSLTDDEAAKMAGLLDSCYWKRCGELRQDGVITETNFTRQGRAGVQRLTSRYNPEHHEAS